MDIKASGTITLSSVIDVKAVYRYYLLQSSNLTIPSKPTTFPPSSTWDDVEPSYTEGSTNSLYFVDCTVFSDDTFLYSEVSLSSSYEAAKSAYNKAVNAQENVDNLENDLSNNVTDIYETMTTQNTDTISTCESIIFTALESYVETGNYTEFRESVESQLSVLAEKIEMTFTTTTESIDRVNGDLQSKYNEITTYFTFEADGLIIGKVDNPYKIVQTNDRYSMRVNDVEVLWIDATTKSAHIPVLTVTEKFMLFGYLIDMDAEGNVNCGYVGGDN